MPFPLIAAVGIGVVGILASGSGLGIGAEFLSKTREKLQKPQNPPPLPPPARMQISRKKMIEDARRKLQMDIVNDYNFGICGTQGAGKQFHSPSDCSKFITIFLFRQILLDQYYSHASTD